ncbi:hypothetical protein NDU88_003042 [Pleurodeles waltl]|uniref:Uncharacterized protein n=1 Tax=Pleurodeles waltl TaxID=8319 RepID=A0AAV7T4E1_PLEWA|nr:hypothetical protein NDU88_003042 [Pleurodeles waltl]
MNRGRSQKKEKEQSWRRTATRNREKEEGIQPHLEASKEIQRYPWSSTGEMTNAATPRSCLRRDLAITRIISRCSATNRDETPAFKMEGCLPNKFGIVAISLGGEDFCLLTRLLIIGKDYKIDEACSFLYYKSLKELP